jgi:hypothetical protein
LGTTVRNQEFTWQSPWLNSMPTPLVPRFELSDDDNNDDTAPSTLILPPTPVVPYPGVSDQQSRGSVHFHALVWSAPSNETIELSDEDRNAPAPHTLPSTPLLGRPVRMPTRSRDWAGSLRTEGVCAHSAGHTYVSTAGHAGHTQFSCSSCTQAHPGNTSIEAHLSTQPGPEADCGICMAGFESAGDCVTACETNHFFHRRCLNRWFAVRRSRHMPANCPVCNTKANPIPYGCRQ